MSLDGCVGGAMGLSAVCDCGFPDHTHLLLTLGNCFVLECVFVF